MEKDRENELVEQMLNILAKESEQKIPQALTKVQKLKLLQYLITIRPAGYLDEDFIKLQDEYLTFKNADQIIDVNKLKCQHGFVETNSNILNLNADMLVVFSSNLLCALDDLNAVDNELVLKGGLQINEDIAVMFSKRRNLILNEPFILCGYNLHCKNVAKVVLSSNIKNDDLVFENIDKILDFVKLNKLNSIAINIKNLLKFYFLDEKTIKNKIKMQIKSKKLKIKIIFAN